MKKAIVSIFLFLAMCAVCGCEEQPSDPIVSEEVVESESTEPITKSFDYNDVEMNEVTSTFIYSLGYGDGNLVIKFRNDGAIYVYYDVPEEVYNELLSAESIGSYFNDNIKGIYQYECVEESSYVEPDFTECTKQEATYVVNTNKRKFHALDCRYVQEMTDNMHYTSDSKESLMDNKYDPCKVCIDE